MYLVWYDDNAKKSVRDKIDEAIDRFQDRFGFAPDHCLVHESSMIDHPRVAVRAVRYVRPGYYQVGCEEDVMAKALTIRATSRPAPLVPVEVSEEPQGRRRRALPETGYLPPAAA